MLKNGDEYRAKLKHLQSTFENKIKSLTDCWIIGADQERAPHITSLNLPGVDNEALIAAVNDRLAIASGLVHKREGGAQPCPYGHVQRSRNRGHDCEDLLRVVQH